MYKLEGSLAQQNRVANNLGLRQLVEVRIKSRQPADHGTQPSTGCLTCNFSDSHYRKKGCYCLHFTVKVERVYPLAISAIPWPRERCRSFQGPLNRASRPSHKFFPRPNIPSLVSIPICFPYLRDSDLRTQLKHVFSCETPNEN